MTFAHDTDSALASTAALVSTLGSTTSDSSASGSSTLGAPDLLSTCADLAAFVTHWEYTGRIDGDLAELESVRGLRHRLRQVWLVDVDEAAHAVNDLLKEGGAQPRLVQHDGWGWHIHATDPQQPLYQRLMVEAAMAFSDVIRDGQMSRLKLCASPECQGVVADLSKNRSRRYCPRGCGNRAHVRAYRERQRAAED